MSSPAELMCVGDISIDTVISLDHLPNPDEKQWATVVGEFPGGMAANVAVSFARLGGRAKLIANIGRDAKGAAALSNLHATSVDVSEVALVDHPTFWTLSLVDRSGQHSMVEFSSPAINPPWHVVDERATQGAAVLYTIGSETSKAIPAFKLCRSRGISTALDVDFNELDDTDSLIDLLALTDVLFCNSETASRLANVTSLEQAVHRLCERGPRTVVVTRGQLGAMALDRREGLVAVDGHPVPAVDTTGAGDCFAGAFLFGQVRGWSLKQRVEVANLMAAMSTTAHGCQARLLALDELAALPEARSLALAELS